MEHDNDGSDQTYRAPKLPQSAELLLQEVRAEYRSYEYTEGS